MYEDSVKKLEYLENVYKLYLNGYVDDSIIPLIKEKLTKAWRTDRTGKYHIFSALLLQLILLLKPCFTSLIYCYINNANVISETIIKHIVNIKVRIYIRLNNLRILFPINHHAFLRLKNENFLFTFSVLYRDDRRTEGVIEVKGIHSQAYATLSSTSNKTIVKYVFMNKQSMLYVAS